MLVALIMAFMLSTASARELPTSKAERQGMSSDRLQRITEVTQQYVDDGKLAGVVTMVARHGKIVHFEAVGQRGADDTTPLPRMTCFESTPCQNQLLQQQPCNSMNRENFN